MRPGERLGMRLGEAGNEAEGGGLGMRLGERLGMRLGERLGMRLGERLGMRLGERLRMRLGLYMYAGIRRVQFTLLYSSCSAH